MRHPSLALSLMYKDELANLKKIVDQNKDLFDKIYITNANSTKSALEPAQKLFKGYKNVEIEYFKWVDDFSAARNSNLDMIKTDYWVWQDMDDYVDFSNIRKLVEKMEAEDLDGMYFPYNYAQDDRGNCIALHWRERLMRTKHSFRWKGALHETLIADKPPQLAKNDEITWVHDNPPSKMAQSLERNIEILEAEYPKGDPRIAHYLGISYLSIGRYLEAIKVLREHIQKSGWDEESYRSQLKIAECYAMLDKPDLAINEALTATKLMTDYPDAYLFLAQVYYDQQEYRRALEWLKVANQKPQPDTFSIVDPTMYGFRATMLAAMANFQIANFETAYELLQQVLKEQPNYEPALNLLPFYRTELQRKRVTDAIEKIALYLQKDKKALKRLYEALPEELQYDARVAPLRNMAKDPHEWSDKSIVIFCGNTFEDWGPDTMDQGMGGSEEAVVNLARQWRDLGYEVTVFNTRDNEYDDDGITYLPWYHIDHRDKFNILICWRAPELAVAFNAKLKVLDVHDVLTEQRMRENYQHYDKIFVKTNYHRTLYPDVPDEKFVVIGNGIDRTHFKKEKKEKATAGYFSAPDRGLYTLLKLWPKIKEKVPEAKLVWHYGWNSYVNAMGEDQLYHAITAEFEKLKDMDVVDGGRVSHEELADVMAKTKVWLYPTEFPEIFCITAVKAEESGMIPVTTGYAALAETSTQGHTIPVEDIYTNEEAQEEFIEAAVEALTEDLNIKPQADADWKDKAKQWHTQFQASLPQETDQKPSKEA